jgi:GST-like protein
MLDFYTWATPNGRKVSIALEEMDLPYRLHTIDISKNEQFAPEFLKLSPNNRIPAIVDHETGISLFESGAILLYLAEKTGKFWPQTPLAQKWAVAQWLMWQMGGPGPMLGQVHHFVAFNPGKSPYAEERYLKEGNRLYGVLDKRLAEAEFVAGDYSVADMAIWPWFAGFRRQTIDMNAYPNVKRWYLAIADRPAVQRGFAVPDLTGRVENLKKEIDRP